MHETCAAVLRLSLSLFAQTDRSVAEADNLACRPTLLPPRVAGAFLLDRRSQVVTSTSGIFGRVPKFTRSHSRVKVLYHCDRKPTRVRHYSIFVVT